MSKAQINVALPRELIDRVRLRAVAEGVTINAIAEKGFEKILSIPIAQFRVCIDKRKIFGRKVSAK